MSEQDYIYFDEPPIEDEMSEKDEDGGFTEWLKRQPRWLRRPVEKTGALAFSTIMSLQGKPQFLKSLFNVGKSISESGDSYDEQEDEIEDEEVFDDEEFDSEEFED